MGAEAALSAEVPDLECDVGLFRRDSADVEALGGGEGGAGRRRGGRCATGISGVGAVEEGAQQSRFPGVIQAEEEDPGRRTRGSARWGDARGVEWDKHAGRGA